MVVWLGILANGLLVTGAWSLARHVLRQSRTVDVMLAAAMLAFTWVVLGVEVLGTLGRLAIGEVLAWSGLLAAAGLIAGRLVRVPQLEAGGVSSPAEPWRCDVRIAFGLVLWATASLAMQSFLLPVKVVSDGPIYHLYFAARWWKAGRLFMVPAPFGENASTYFPANGDAWFAWLMVTWGGDRLARIGQAPFLFIAGLAAFATARRLGASRNAAGLACCFFVTSTPLLIFTFEANVDTIFIAAYLCAVYFWLRYLADDRRLDWLLLGGLAAGLALGAKPVAIVFVIPLIALASAIDLIDTRSILRTMATGLAVVPALVIPSAFWYVRNVVLTGNPMYPLEVSLAGRTVLQGCYDRAAMRFSPYYLPLSDWRAFADILVSILDPRLALLWLAATAGLWQTSRGQARSADRWTWAMSILAMLNVGLYWFCIPYRTQQRFMLQALGLAAIPLARLLDRGLPILAPAATVLLGLHLLTPATWPVTLNENEIPWDLSPTIPNVALPPLRVLRLVEQSGKAVLQPAPPPGLVFAIAAGACSLLATWTWGRPRREGRNAVHGRAIATACLIGVAAFTAFETGAPGADARLLFYPAFRDFYLGWQNLEQRSGPAGARVAYAGTNIPYYLFAAGLRNEVQYVNIDGRRDGLLHDYHRAVMNQGVANWPNPRPGWDRANPDYAAWLANLLSSRIQLLVVTRVNPAEGPHNVADPAGFPIERVWADGHPERFELVYGASEGDPFFRIYRLRQL